MNLYEELRKKDSFSSVEKDVADYIVENGESILDGKKYTSDDKI